MSARLLAVAASSSLLMGLIAGSFWYFDWRYSRPTPRPPELVELALGARVPVSEWLAKAGLDAGGRSVHLHFFNPSCPCSRFNVDHLHELVRRFGKEVFFVALIEADEADETELPSIVTDLGIPWITDVDGRIAKAAGIYSTPQAFLVTADGTLFYRGNYNTSRYCNDPRTEFARMALEAIVQSRSPSSLPESPAYGCELPAQSSSTVMAATRWPSQETQ